jgi:hypothetical protein
MCAAALIKGNYKCPIVQPRMTPINFAKGCHPCPSVLSDGWHVLFVVIIPLLVSQRFPLEWRFCLAPGIAAATPWQASQWGQGSGLCELVLLGRRVTNEELLNRTIKYDKTRMGLFRYYMDELY